MLKKKKKNSKITHQHIFLSTVLSSGDPVCTAQIDKSILNLGGGDCIALKSRYFYPPLHIRCFKTSLNSRFWENTVFCLSMLTSKTMFGTRWCHQLSILLTTLRISFICRSGFDGSGLLDSNIYNNKMSVSTHRTTIRAVTNSYFH